MCTTDGAGHLAAVGQLTPAGATAPERHCDVDCADLLVEEAPPAPRYERLFEEAPFAYFTVAPSGLITESNRRASSMVGRPQDQLVGSMVLDLYADDAEGRPRAEALLTLFRAGEPINDEVLAMRGADDRTVWVRLTAIPVLDDQGRVIESRSIAIDITEQRRAEDELRRLAFVDDLTGLANRRAFLEALAQLPENPPTPGWWLSFAFVDLEDLKGINDRYSHGMGDLALVDVADALRATLPEGSPIARFGADEFAAVTRGHVPLEEATFRAQLAGALSELHVSHARPYPLRASVGVVSEALGVDAPDVLGLLDAADRRMCRHKSTSTREVARSDFA